MLANGAISGVIGVSAYQILKLYIAPWTVILIVLSICAFFGYRAFGSIKLIPADESTERKIKSSIELTPTAAKLTAYIGIVGSFILTAGCIFIIAVLDIKGETPSNGIMLFSALALVGLIGLVVSVRILRGKSLLPGYPVRKS